MPGFRVRGCRGGPVVEVCEYGFDLQAWVGRARVGRAAGGSWNAESVTTAVCEAFCANSRRCDAKGSGASLRERTSSTLVTAVSDSRPAMYSCTGSSSVVKHARTISIALLAAVAMAATFPSTESFCSKSSESKCIDKYTASPLCLWSMRLTGVVSRHRTKALSPVPANPAHASPRLPLSLLGAWLHPPPPSSARWRRTRRRPRSSWPQ